MNNGLQKKRIKEIANFIVNNITLAEVSTIIIDRSMEVAEYIVKNNLDPKEFQSVVLRSKLHEKLKKTKPSMSYTPFYAPKALDEKEQLSEEGLFTRVWRAIINKKEQDAPRSGFTTKNTK